ncbi:hypothetical protein IscW_ISCW020037 [Ixodes scapularis]|uniref:PiggyBac transposable element-derived protein 4 C-terminal zinc-ribbon domain-containing protein n=1 Tax=Ixodes scapularis TaxID=6945 RepID=B7Q225_IXOSC|nr:hypothetical protein IscW_ISCW020037 [Ixodes scapularis]|eukprot:XP_002410346.1 hypothetical protein IscW_ISCW020037 [Ixodes scapularis]
MTGSYDVLTKSRFEQQAFRTELVEQLLGLDGAESAHLPPGPEQLQHKPQRMEKRRNCKMCYDDSKVEHKTKVFCSTCDLYLCFTTSRNCFAQWHDMNATTAGAMR